MKVLIVVDMQNDFIDGALGTEEAVRIVPKVAEKIKGFDGKIFFTRDTHEDDYLESQEGRNLPVVHCVRETHRAWAQASGVYDGTVGQRRGKSGVYHSCRVVHRYMRHFQRYDHKGVLPGDPGTGGRFLLRGRDAGEP